MATKSPTFREIVNSIRQKNPAPVYLLMGEEAYYLDKIVEELEEHTIEEEDRDFNSLIFYGAEANIEEILGVVRQYPTMAERQLVILKEAQAMFNAKNTLDKLEGYVKNPVKTTVFAVVFKGGDLNATSALMKAANAQKDAVVFKSPILRDYQLEAPIRGYVSEKGLTIDSKSVALLIESIGSDLSKLFGEIDKLTICMPKGVKEITPDLIERNIGISKDYNDFELTNALQTKDYLKAMRIVDYYSKLQKRGTANMRIVPMIFGYFSKLAICKFSKDQSNDALMALLGCKESSLRNLRTGLNNYTPMQIVKAISAMREFDVKSKGVGSLQNEFDLLRELVFKIFSA